MDQIKIQLGSFTNTREEWEFIANVNNWDPKNETLEDCITRIANDVMGEHFASYRNNERKMAVSQIEQENLVNVQEWKESYSKE